MEWNPMLAGTAVLLAFGPAANAQCLLEEAGSVAPTGNADHFGQSVALRADTLVVGANKADGMGAAYVYYRDLGGPDNWGEVTRLQPAALLSNGDFGYDAALDGDTLFVGAPGQNSPGGAFAAGAVFIFERHAGGPDNWGETQRIPGEVGGRSFGLAVAVDGDRAVVGASGDPFAGQHTGAAHFLERNPSTGTWTTVQVVHAATPSQFAFFGVSVAMDGDTALVGAVGHQSSGPPSGAVHVFLRDPATNVWSESQALVASNKAQLDRFGEDVALEGDRLAVGAPWNPWGGSATGAAYVFERAPGGDFLEVVQLTPQGQAAGHSFGGCVELDGDSVLVGANRNAPHPVCTSVFQKDHGGPGNWGELHKLEQTGKELDYARAAGLEGGTLFLTDWTEERAFRYELTPDPHEPFVSYCAPGTSGLGCQVTLGLCGHSSATASEGFKVQAFDVNGLVTGIFFYGTNGRQAVPWGNGTSTQCVAPPVSRAPLSSAGGFTPCGGSAVRDLAKHWTKKPHKNPGAGALVQAQFWYRDSTNTSNRSTSLSEAIEFTVGP